MNRFNTSQPERQTKSHVTGQCNVCSSKKNISIIKYRILLINNNELKQTNYKQLILRIKRFHNPFGC